jgi:RNA polymerase sigma factor (sigma-70 family)
MSVPLPRMAEDDEPGDAELIDSVRSGDLNAYGLLYRRHAASAARLARQLTGSPAEADDLVSEAFAKVLDVLRGGGGPDVAFRAYLLTTLRNCRYEWARRDRKLTWSDDMTRHDPGSPWVDTAVAEFESSVAARAFRRLPERWRTVLWHTEVEQESPAEVAPLLGLTPNAVAALAYRAREGLRQAYLQEHLPNGVDREHMATVNGLGAWARGGLSRHQRARLDAHLASCAECRTLAAELQDVNAGLRGVIAPLVLGTGAVAAYLASRSGSADAAVTSAMAGGTTAGGGTAGSATGGSAAAGGEAVVGGGATVAGAGGIGSAGVGTGALGGAAAGGIGSVTTAGGGSALGSVAAWVAGTHVGQAAAAAAVAVLVGGGTVVATLHGGPAAAEVASTVSAGLLDPTEGPGTSPPVPRGDPRNGRAASGTGLNGSADPGPRPTGAPAQTGPDGRGAPTSRPGHAAGPSHAASGGPAGAPAVPQNSLPAKGLAAGKPVLSADRPQAQGALRQDAPGEIAVSIRNTGAGGAVDLVAVVRLPAGFTAEPDGTADGWQCTAGDRNATCTRTELDPGASTTLHVSVTLDATAVAGTVSGTVRAAQVATVPIPPAPLTILR